MMKKMMMMMMIVAMMVGWCIGASKAEKQPLWCNFNFTKT